MIAIHECGFRDLWPLPCWKYRDSLNATTNVAFSRPVWICMLWISWWKCPVNWNASLFLAQLHQIDGDWTFPHFSFTVPLILFRCVDFTKCINKKCLLTLWDAFFCTVHLKKCFQQLIHYRSNKCRSCKWGGGGLLRRRKTAALISILIIYWNMKGEETKSWLQRHNFRSAGGAEGKTSKREAASWWDAPSGVHDVSTPELLGLKQTFWCSLSEGAAKPAWTRAAWNAPLPHGRPSQPTRTQVEQRESCQPTPTGVKSELGVDGAMAIRGL